LGAGSVGIAVGMAAMGIAPVGASDEEAAIAGKGVQGVVCKERKQKGYLWACA
jgi:hypothetical protein